MPAEPSLESAYPKRRPALLAGGAAVLGAAAGAVLTPGAGWSLGLLLAGLTLLALAVWLARAESRLVGPLCALAISAMFCGYAGLRAEPDHESLMVIYPQGAELVRLRGVVVEGGDYVKRDPTAFEFPDRPEPEADFPIGRYRFAATARYLLEVGSLPDLERNASGAVRLYLPPGAKLELQSEIEVLGSLRLPRRAGNPGEGGLRKRLLRRGITHVMSVSDLGRVRVVGRAGEWDPARIAPFVHDWFHERIGSRMPRARAALVGAILLGERGNLTPAHRAQFVRSGTVHLLVVSGLHVGLVALVVVMVLRLAGVSLRWRWGLAALTVLFYLLVTGVQPSVLRATIMVVIYALGHVLKRRPDSLNVLAAAALLSLALDPGAVVDLGFQLSYLAVLGILVVFPALRLSAPLAEAERPGLPASRVVLRFLGGSVGISLAVSVATWPLLAYALHVVSPAMLVTNLFAAPLLLVMMALAMLSPLSLIPGVGALLAGGLSLLAGLLDALTAFFAGVPGGHLFLAAPPEWWLAGYYLFLLSVFVAPKLGLPRISGAVAWMLWLCLLPAAALAASEPPGPLRVTVLDVGQGQCVVIEVPTGPCAVLDCGSTSLGGAGERVLAPFLWSRGRRRIDLLLVSHADADHVNGLAQLFERFEVGTVLVSEMLERDQAGRDLRAWLAARTEVRTFKRGEQLELAPEITIRCLWPDPRFVEDLITKADRRNEGGLVLELQAGSRRVLLPSDVEHRGFAGFVDRYRTRGVDVLLAPHQGSEVEGLEGLLDLLRPEHVIVSARPGFASESALDTYRGRARLWQTRHQGAITILIGAEGKLQVAGYLDR